MDANFIIDALSLCPVFSPSSFFLSPVFSLTSEMKFGFSIYLFLRVELTASANLLRVGQASATGRFRGPDKYYKSPLLVDGDDDDDDADYDDDD